MRTTSANVLNEADAFERRMRWIEFQQEIAFVWDFTPLSEDLMEDPEYLPNRYIYTENQWRPGVPLFGRPTPFVYESQCIRRMIDEFWCHDEEEDAQFSRTHWCRECQVGWNGTEAACWMCKQTDAVESFHSGMNLRYTNVIQDFDGDTFLNVEEFRPQLNAMSNQFSIYASTMQRFGEAARTVAGPIESMAEWLRSEMRAELDDAIFNRLWSQANPARDEPHLHFQIDEWRMRPNPSRSLNEWRNRWTPDADGMIQVSVRVPYDDGSEVITDPLYQDSDGFAETHTLRIPADWRTIQPTVPLPEAVFPPAVVETEQAVDYTAFYTPPTRRRRR